jgi:uncharacterized membrane protein YfcA
LTRYGAALEGCTAPDRRSSRLDSLAPQDDGPIESLTPLVIAYCSVVMAIAYSARGASGFGAAAALPLLGLVLPLKILVPAWSLIALFAASALLGSDRKKVLWTEILRLIPGTIVGILVGLYVFTLLSSETLAKWIGGFVLLYGLYSLWATFRSATHSHLPPKVAAALGGFAGGMTGTVVGTMGSTFYAIYFDAIRLNKDNYRATMTAILLTLTLLRGIGYYAVGEFTRDVLIVTAILFPSMLLGIFIGSRFHHGMSETAFRRTVSCALIASGLALLAK